MPVFAHLHVHTDYSLLDGACAIDKLIKKVANLKQTHVAITDHGNMHGALEFYHAAKKASVTPVIGLETYMAHGALTEKVLTPNGDHAYHLTLLAMDEEGYRNLCKLSSIANLEGFYYKPRIDFETLGKYSNGLICLSGCIGGRIPHHLDIGEYPAAHAEALKYRDLFGDRFYLELQDHGLERQKKVNEGLLSLSRETGIQVVATNDAHYIDKDDAFAHEVLLCIGMKKRLSDRDRMSFESQEFYIKSGEEMLALFSHDAVENSQTIAERCKLVLNFEGYVIPGFSDGTGQAPAEILRRLVNKGIANRYGASPSQEIRDRVEHELRIVSDMGFETYFLVVQDFVDYAHKNGVPVGPGRGSAAGSIIAYALDITDIDPMRFDLIFERFLNPGRSQMPDIDIDFCQENRYKVIDYVVNKYGYENVAQVITFGTLGARAVVRDVGRVLEMPQHSVDRLAKMIPGVPGMTLNRAIESSSELLETINSNVETKNLINVALRLEGLARNPSVHAAAVVICDRPLSNYLPLSRAKKEAGEDQAIVTQYSKDWVEKIGLLKMDFLGLTTLTTLEYALANIRESSNKEIKFDDELADKKTYKLLSSGHTMGIFQLESRGMRDLIVRLKPDCYDDIMAVLALYRPGPLGGGMVETFVERKHGRQATEYMHPILEPILKSTYGVILYQEQVIRIASIVGGFSLAEADKLRKAMGKKIPDIMDADKKKFIENAPACGVNAELADKLFDYILNFAGYGFNKSHSAAYAMITYRSAFLKAHYPLEFMAAVLSSVLSDTDRLLDRLEECRQAGYNILPPDVNKSRPMFTKEGKKGIRFALGAIKGVGTKAAAGICEIATSKPFTGIFDFCERVDSHMINKGTIEALINAGALDCLPGNRKQKISVMEDAINSAQQIQNDRDSGQMNLFGGIDTSAPRENLPRMEEFPEEESLQRECSAIGFFLTKHPVSRYEDLRRIYSNRRVKDILSSAKEPAGTDEPLDGGFSLPLEERTEEDTGSRVIDGENVILAVRVAAIKKRLTKDGKQMAVLTLEDTSGSIESVIFSELWVRLGNELMEMPVDSVFFVGGYVDFSRETPQIVVEEMARPSAVIERFTDTIALQLTGNSETVSKSLKWLYTFIEHHAGPVRVSLRIPFDNDIVFLSLPREFQVRLDEESRAEISARLGENCIVFTPRRTFATTSRRRNGFGSIRNSYRH